MVPETREEIDFRPIEIPQGTPRLLGLCEDRRGSDGSWRRRRWGLARVSYRPPMFSQVIDGANRWISSRDRSGGP